MIFMCIATIIVNMTPTWELTDTKALKRAEYVCQTRYKSCLKKFIKKEKQVYHAICG